MPQQSRFDKWWAERSKSVPADLLAIAREWAWVGWQARSTDATRRADEAQQKEREYVERCHAEGKVPYEDLMGS